MYDLLMALFSRFRRPKVVEYNRESSRQHQSPIGTKYHVIEDDRGLIGRGDWNHSILLSGFSEIDAKLFTRELADRIKTGPPLVALSHHDFFGTLINQHIALRSSRREFYSPKTGEHELRFKLHETKNLVKKSAIGYAMKANVPLEFGYPRSEDSEEIHSRRVNVTRMGTAGFVGVHSRGTRSYLFDKVAWTSVSTDSRIEPNRVGHEPLLLITVRHVKGKTKVIFKVGQLRDNGKLAPGVESRL